LIISLYCITTLSSKTEELDPVIQQELESIANYIHQDQFEESINASEAFMAKHPEDGTIHYLRGYAFMHLNKLEMASDAFDQSIRFNRSSPEAHFQKAIVLRNMKE